MTSIDHLVTTGRGQTKFVEGKLGTAVREGVKFAALMFCLSIPILLLRIDSDIDHKPFLQLRWTWPLLAAAIGFLVRFGGLALASTGTKISSKINWHIPPSLSRYFATAGLVFLVLYPLLMLALVGRAGSIKWIDNFGIQVMIYVMLGWGLNIVVGLAGLLDLGYVAFYAVGAY